jgi:hypothetical protein
MSESIEGLNIGEFKIKLNPEELNKNSINIFITGHMKNYLANIFHPNSLKLELYGKFFKQLPKAIERIIRWKKVPLQLSPYINKAVIENPFEAESKFQIEIHIGTLVSEYRSSFTYKDFVTQLKQLTKNDDIIEVTFQNTEIELFSVFTKPSLILSSIEYDVSALWTGPIPEDIRSEADFFRIIRWLFFPVLFLTLVWILCMNPNLVTSKVPALFSENIYGHARPYYQITQSKALKFSKLEGALIEFQKQNNTEEMRPVLDDIGELFRVENITLDEVRRIRNQIEHDEMETRALQRPLDLFTLANFMWLFAFMCFIISIYSNLGSLINFFRMQVLNPTFNLLEILAYFVISMVVIEGFRFTSVLGFFITLTGVFLGIFYCIYYSNFLHSPFKPYKHNAFFTFLLYIGVLPLAIYYESYLLSWYLVTHCYTSFNNGTYLPWICNYIGFSQHYRAIMTCINSLMLHTIFIGSKILGITLIKAFQLPIIIVGCICLSISLLYVTSYHYGDIWNYRCGRITYLKKQIAIVAHLVCCVLVGYSLGIAGLINTGCVFFILYVMLLYIELHLRKVWNKQILCVEILGAFYLSAFYLPWNLEVFITLFSYDKLLK